MKQAITSGKLRQRKKGTHTDYVAMQYGSPAYMVISIACLNNWSATEII